MAVTAFQSEVLKRIARSRIDGGETYIAGGLALNHQLKRPRLSSDIDVFNSSYSALERAADHDCAVLKAAGYDIRVARRRDYIVEVVVSGEGGATELQWVQDSAYRFFPLVEDELLGLTLHPFDLATNKILALASRRVPRDWVDTITCSEDIQPLGLLAWAANGKDLGLTPNYILEMCSRTIYTPPEFELAIKNAQDYDLASLSAKWHEMIWKARDTVKLLPPSEVGKAVMTKDGKLFKGDDEALKAALAAGELEFHEGTLGGAWPRIIG